MEIRGYKSFNKELTNRYGINFSIGKIYVAHGAIKFGNDGNGFHMCKNIEDTFRYFDANNISVCEVIGSGQIVERTDEYYGYYDMYCVEKLKIIRELSRKEIISIGLGLNEIRVKRFLSTFILKEEEIILFKEQFKKYMDVLDTIAYHQENDEDIYYRRLGLTRIK